MIAYLQYQMTEFPVQHFHNCAGPRASRNRKKGRYISKDRAETVVIEKRTESESDRNWIEGETINDWTNEN
jgi:hypothetical protein